MVSWMLLGFLLFAFFAVSEATPNPGPYSNAFQQWCEANYMKDVFIWLLVQHGGSDLSKSKLQWSLLLKRVAKYFTEAELHNSLEHEVEPQLESDTPFVPFFLPAPGAAGAANAPGGGPAHSAAGAATQIAAAGMSLLAIAPIQQNLPQALIAGMGILEGEDGTDPDDEDKGISNPDSGPAGPAGPGPVPPPSPGQSINFAKMQSDFAAKQAAEAAAFAAKQAADAARQSQLAQEEALHAQDLEQVQHLMQQQQQQQPLADQHQALVAAQQQTAQQIVQLQQQQQVQQQQEQQLAAQIQQAQAAGQQLAQIQARMAAREVWARELMQRHD